MAQEQTAEMREMRVVKNPHNRLLLWLECVTTKGGNPEGKALTHHNIADLQHSGVFLAHLDVSLSLDNRTLGVLNKQTHQEESITIDNSSSDADLSKASWLLTSALKPPTARPAETQPEPNAASSSSPTEERQPETSSPQMAPEPLPGTAMPSAAVMQEPATSPAEDVIAPSTGLENVVSDRAESIDPLSAGTPAKTEQADKVSALELVEAALPAPPPAHSIDQTVLALFTEADPVCVNTEIFRRLGPRFGILEQDVRLSLPRVFENRRFEIISFNHSEIESILELRSEEFFGFYLSHIDERHVMLVYACKRRRLEWGPEKCLLEATAASEPVEFKGSALLGLAQDQNGHFVFVVRPEYMQWIKPYEKQCQEEFAHFVTVERIAATPDQYAFIWPERPIALSSQTS
jgi:hypothetical protein